MIQDDQGSIEFSPIKSKVPLNLELDFVKLVNLKEIDEKITLITEDPLTALSLSKIESRQDSNNLQTNRSDGS